jgi:hypothetical protein
MRIAMISITPLTPCGIAKNSDMLIRELKKQCNVEVLLIDITKSL